MMIRLAKIFIVILTFLSTPAAITAIAFTSDNVPQAAAIGIVAGVFWLRAWNELRDAKAFVDGLFSPT